MISDLCSLEAYKTYLANQWIVRLISWCAHFLSRLFEYSILIVPHIFSLSTSGINITTSFGAHLSSNYVEFAFSQFKTFRQYSTTIAWKPRQIPKKGVFQVRQYWAARTFPRKPLLHLKARMYKRIREATKRNWNEKIHHH